MSTFKKNSHLHISEQLQNNTAHCDSGEKKEVKSLANTELFNIRRNQANFGKAQRPRRNENYRASFLRFSFILNQNKNFDPICEDFKESCKSHQ